MREDTFHNHLEVLKYKIEIRLPDYKPDSLPFRSKHAELEWLRKLGV